MGLGDTENRNVPIAIELLEGIEVFYLNAGEGHSGLVDDQHDIYMWGSNEFGQLGIGETEGQVIEPVHLETEFNVNKIVCGYKNTLLLTEDFLVYGCGANQKRQVSDEEEDKITEFTLINELEDIERIFCTDFMMAINKDYSVYVWGGEEDSFCDYSKPHLLTEFENRVINASIGESFIIIIDKDLFAYSCGNNSKGQLGYSDTTKENNFAVIEKLCQNPLKSVVCGKDFVMGLGGILIPNPNKIKIDESQFNFGKNYIHQQNFHNSNEGSNKNSNIVLDRPGILKRDNREVFESFNSPNNTAGRQYKSNPPTFTERKGSEDEQFGQVRMSDAVDGFKSEVYSILQDIKSKNPDLDTYINKDQLDRLKKKEDQLNMLLSNYTSSKRNTNEEEKLNEDMFLEAIEILEGIILEYDKVITFDNHKLIYSQKLEELKVR